MRNTIQNECSVFSLDAVVKLTFIGPAAPQMWWHYISGRLWLFGKRLMLVLITKNKRETGMVVSGAAWLQAWGGLGHVVPPPRGSAGARRSLLLSPSAACLSSSVASPQALPQVSASSWQRQGIYPYYCIVILTPIRSVCQFGQRQTQRWTCSLGQVFFL